jgi:hypothetical protein
MALPNSNDRFRAQTRQTRCISPSARFRRYRAVGSSDPKYRSPPTAAVVPSGGTVGKHLFFDRVAAGTIATQDAP